MSEKPISDLKEISDKIKEITGAERIGLNPISLFIRNMSVNSKKHRLRVTLEFNSDEVLVNKNDIRFWRGNLLLLWIEFKDKKIFKVI